MGAMGYNRARIVMRKTIIMSLFLALVSLTSFRSTYKDVIEIEVGVNYHVEAELSNEEYNQKLFLYSDGTCVVVTEQGRGSGSYDIQGEKIFITWNNGIKQQGSVRKDDGKVRSVSIEGVTYSRKLVVKRN